MVNSMTGYGKGTESFGGREITVEIKSVNHRFFEFSARVPRTYAFLEERLKSFAQKKISRGKTEVNVSIVNLTASDAKVTVSEAVAKEYVDALRTLCKPLNVADDIRLSTLSRFPDIFIVTREETDEEQLWQEVLSVANKAVDAFIAMREREGRNLRDDLLEKLLNIETLVHKVEERSPERVQQYRERLYQKISEVVADTSIDDDRILSEAAIFADKIAVDEETARLKSHISQFREILELSEPVGRKLDFLVQEFNREANTIGSKCQDIESTRYALDMKSEIEKIREQVQNIE